MPIYGNPQMVVLTCFLGNIMGLVRQFKWKTLSHPLLHHVQAYLTALLIWGEPNPCSGTRARSKNGGCCTSGCWWLLVSSPLNIGSPPGDLQQNHQLDGSLWCWTTMRRHENHGQIIYFHRPSPTFSSSWPVESPFRMVKSESSYQNYHLTTIFHGFIACILLRPPHLGTAAQPFSLRNASLKFPLESTLVVQNAAAALCVPEAGSIYIHVGFMFIHLYTYIHTYITYIHTYITYIHTLHYITLHYITFTYHTYIHTYITYIHTLHYITLHYIPYIHTYIYTSTYLYIYYTIVTKTNADTCDELVGFYFPI